VKTKQIPESKKHRKSSTPSIGISPFTMERVLNEIGLTGSPRSKADRRSAAQQLAYNAWEAISLEAALKLARRAVQLHPACVDALMILAQAKSKSREDEIKEMERIVNLGAKDLGEQFFKRNRGHFWGILETRPYMRASTYLAQILADAGRISDAIKHYEEMLKLNPNDNQGLRYPLIGHYLAMGRLKQVHGLFKQFEDEESAVFDWARVLERFLSDDAVGATSALAKARKQNKFVEAYLIGHKRMPKHMPEMYGWGDENEAIVCADALGAAWNRHPEAAAWLKAQTQEPPPTAALTARRVGRNDPCPCGSGRKYKQCHGKLS